jgi:hypothetical protein
MKTHELAKALTQLSKLLRNLPNQELSEFENQIREPNRDPYGNVGISLSALAGFTKYSKADWEKVVSDFELPIEIRARDASRDIMGKILNYLADNGAERQRIARVGRVSSGEPSELTTALKFLLSDD